MQDSSKDSFIKLYHEYKQPVFTIIYRIVQSIELAEDVMQDVFLKIYISPPDNSIRNVRAWIFQVARNQAIDVWRRNQRERVAQEANVLDDNISLIHLKMDLESAMSKLPCDEREIVTLHLNAELTFIEIGKIVGLSLPSTYRKYQKALKTLQKLLGGAV